MSHDSVTGLDILTPELESEYSFSYSEALSRAMWEMGQDHRTVFLGQGVLAPGTFMSTTMEGVPLERRYELPVAEEMQMGMSIGMALAGYVPISIYPRWNFLLLAANQLVNHLDKMQAHVIVRVGVGSTKPLYPGPQHVGDFTEAFAHITQNTIFRRLYSAEDVIPAYQYALKRGGPTVLVEFADLYES